MRPINSCVCVRAAECALLTACFSRLPYVPQYGRAVDGSPVPTATSTVTTPSISARSPSVSAAAHSELQDADEKEADEQNGAVADEQMPDTEPENGSAATAAAAATEHADDQQNPTSAPSTSPIPVLATARFASTTTSFASSRPISRAGSTAGGSGSGGNTAVQYSHSRIVLMSVSRCGRWVVVVGDGPKWPVWVWGWSRVASTKREVYSYPLA